MLSAISHQPSAISHQSTSAISQHLPGYYGNQSAQPRKHPYPNHTTTPAIHASNLIAISLLNAPTTITAARCDPVAGSDRIPSTPVFTPVAKRLSRPLRGGAVSAVSAVNDQRCGAAEALFGRCVSSGDVSDAEHGGGAGEEPDRHSRQRARKPDPAAGTRHSAPPA